MHITSKSYELQSTKLVPLVVKVRSLNRVHATDFFKAGIAVFVEVLISDGFFRKCRKNCSCEKSEFDTYCLLDNL